MIIQKEAVTERIENPGEAECPVRELLNKIGSAWSVLIVIELSAGKKRFTELQRSIMVVAKISQKMLTQTLRDLERDGLVTRTVYPTRPPSVEYELTELGFSLLAPIEALSAWANENRAAVARARTDYDAAVPAKML